MNMHLFFLLFFVLIFSKETQSFIAFTSSIHSTDEISKKEKKDQEYVVSLMRKLDLYL